jgi:hypothetical protein
LSFRNNPSWVFVIPNREAVRNLLSARSGSDAGRKQIPPFSRNDKAPEEVEV